MRALAGIISYAVIVLIAVVILIKEWNKNRKKRSDWFWKWINFM